MLHVFTSPDCGTCQKNHGVFRSLEDIIPVKMHDIDDEPCCIQEFDLDYVPMLILERDEKRIPFRGTSYDRRTLEEFVAHPESDKHTFRANRSVDTKALSQQLGVPVLLYEGARSDAPMWSVWCKAARSWPRSLWLYNDDDVPQCVHASARDALQIHVEMDESTFWHALEEAVAPPADDGGARTLAKRLLGAETAHVRERHSNIAL